MGEAGLWSRESDNRKIEKSEMACLTALFFYSLTLQP